MKKIIDIFEKLSEDVDFSLAQNYNIDLLDYIGDDYLNKWKHPDNRSKNSIYVGLGRNVREIRTGDTFTILFPYSNPKEFVKVKATIKFVNARPEIPTKSIPIGYNGVALIEFEGGKPKLLEKLQKYSQDPREVRDPKFEELVLTNQNIMDMVLELWDEE